MNASVKQIELISLFLDKFYSSNGRAGDHCSLNAKWAGSKTATNWVELHVSLNETGPVEFDGYEYRAEFGVNGQPFIERERLFTDITVTEDQVEQYMKLAIANFEAQKERRAEYKAKSAVSA